METFTHPSTLTTTAADTLLLTLDEAARQLRCARRSVERHIASHRLRVVHLGRSVRVERRELERFIAQMRDVGDADAEVHDE
jgi:excisionase family DNA binding protein